MDNNFSSKHKLDKAVVVIELAATYTRRTIHTFFESEVPTVQTSEKRPYCSFQVNNNQIGKPFGNLNLYQSFVTYKDLKDVLHKVFIVHQREYHISKTFRKRSHKQDIQWVIILPAGIRFQSKIKKAAHSAGLNRYLCQYIFSSDILALHNANEESNTKTNNKSGRETTQVSYLYFDEGFGEICSYDVLQDGTVCNNSRKTDQVDGGSLEYYIERLLCRIFTNDYICWYIWKYKYHYNMLYKDFEEKVRVYDNATSGITLNCKHFVTKIKEYYSVPVDFHIPINCLIWNSKYRDIVRYDADTSSLVFSQQVLQKIMDDLRLSVTKCLKSLLKHQTSLICYLQMELCTSSYNFQQGLEQEMQYGNGLLGSLACKEGETVTSDYTIGYVAIENFNKEQHSEHNKSSLCLDNTGEECAIWIFRPLIKKGQQITVRNEFIWTESITFTSKQNKNSIHETHVMRSKFSNPQYIKEEGCELAVTIQSHPPAEGWPDEVEFQYTLAVIETGPIIRVVDLKAAQTLTAKFTYKLNIEFLKDPSSVAMQSPILARLHPQSIRRRANHTYGVESIPLFHEEKHLKHLKLVDSEGLGRCRAVLYKLIEKGQLLHQGQMSSSVVPNIYTSWNTDFTLYRSPLEDPRCIEDPDDQCKVVARIKTSNFTDNKYDTSEKFDVLLIVEDTNIIFKVISRKTGLEMVKYVDF